jgi:hypothetical protein
MGGLGKGTGFQSVDHICLGQGMDQWGGEGEGISIPVTGRGGPYGCETSKIARFLDSKLTDGGDAVNLMRRPPFTP